MRVPTHDNRIIELKDFIFSYDDYHLLITLQQKHPNMLVEVISQDATKKVFVPLHLLDLEEFSTLKLYNSAYS